MASKRTFYRGDWHTERDRRVWQQEAEYRGFNNGMMTAATAVVEGRLWGVWCVNDRTWCSGTIGSEADVRRVLPEWQSGKAAAVDSTCFTYEARRVESLRPLADETTETKGRP